MLSRLRTYPVVFQPISMAEPPSHVLVVDGHGSVLYGSIENAFQRKALRHETKWKVPGEGCCGALKRQTGLLPTPIDPSRPAHQERLKPPSQGTRKVSLAGGCLWRKMPSSVRNMENPPSLFMSHAKG